MNSHVLKRKTNQLLSVFGLTLANKEVHEQAIEKVKNFETLVKAQHLADAPLVRLLAQLTPKQRQAIYHYLLLSKSQLAQDLFVVSQSLNPDFPRFFVEFGATDGVQLSNTYLLEKYFGWQGILAEPAKVWHESLRNNRNCSIELACVSTCSNMTVEFLEAGYDPEDFQSSPELSSILEFAESGDQHTKRRLRNAKSYKVSTISLNDLLEKYSAPADIGYLSIDTEGSELSILENVDFDRYKFRIITVEHNYVEEKRWAIHNLLSRVNYTRVLESVSSWDDWYILDQVTPQDKLKR
jgi:FkbM family methyltransferase